jgi:hypothetical protein
MQTKKAKSKSNNRSKSKNNKENPKPNKVQETQDKMPINPGKTQEKCQ